MYEMQRVAATPTRTPPKRETTVFDPQRIREDFPILHTKVYGKPLVYLDNGATTQKPRAVIDAVSVYYESQNANIHRGVYHLSQVATGLYEGTRERIARARRARGEVPHTAAGTRTRARHSNRRCRSSSHE